MKDFFSISLSSPQKSMKCKTLNLKKLKIFHGTVSYGKRVVGSFDLPFNTNFFSFQFNIEQLQFEGRPDGFVLPGPSLLLQWCDDAIQAETSQHLVEGTRQGLTAASASLPLLSPQIQTGFFAFAAGSPHVPILSS